MRTNLMSSAALVAAASLLMALPAGAETIQWTLQNALFDDGGTASGSFDYNTVSGAYFDIDFTTTAGSELGGTTYTAEDPASVPRNYGFGSITAVGATAAGDPLLDINTTAATGFTTPGVVTIGAPSEFVSSEGTCFDDGCTSYNPVRSLSGSLVGVAVPEPAIWAMMLMGFGGLGVAMRSRRMSKAATA